MPNLAWPLLILAAGGGIVLGLWRLGALTPPAVRAWQTIGKHHDLVDVRPLGDRLAERAPLIRRLRDAIDIERLLAIAGRDDSAAGWVLKRAGLALVFVVVLSALDGILGLVNGELPYPLLLPLLFGGAWFLLYYRILIRQARTRQELIDNALAESLPELAILTFTGVARLEVAVDRLAVAHKDGALYGLLKDDSWRQLVQTQAEKAPFRSYHSRRDDQALVRTATIWEAIGEKYEIPMFGVLASNLRRMDDKGATPHRVLTNLAMAVSNNRLAALMVQSEQSRVRHVVPVALMVLPILVLIGYPTVAALLEAFNQ
jgi:hypothetical protein